LALKAPFNNKLPTQTNDVMVNPENPENPDSKIGCSAHNFQRRMGEIVFGLAGDGYFWGMFTPNARF
jgi:hypothetical protein